MYLYTLDGPRRSFRAYIPCEGQASDNVNIWKADINLEIKKKKKKDFWVIKSFHKAHALYSLKEKEAHYL